MPARLYCPVGDLQIDHTFETEATLGRSSENSLVLHPEVLSSNHLEVRWNPQWESYEIEDLGSSNGTRLDGTRLREPQRLGHLHLITLAERYHMVFQDLDRCAARHAGAGRAAGVPRRAGAKPEDTSTPGAEQTMVMSLPVPIPIPRSLLEEPESGSADTTERTIFERLPIPLPNLLRKEEAAAPAPEAKAPASAASRGAGPRRPAPTRPIRPGEVLGRPKPSGADQAQTARFYLEVDEEAGKQTYPLFPGRHVLGRGRQADLQVPSPHLSRAHALLVVDGSRVTLEDQGSKNSTFVEGTKILDEVTLEPGQEIAFGLLKARVVRIGG